MTSKRTTDIGSVNRNRQEVVRRTDLAGNDHLQKVYVLRCRDCEFNYGANGSDIYLRRCPNCQGGAAGLPYDLAQSSVSRRQAYAERQPAGNRLEYSAGEGWRAIVRNGQ